MSVFFKTIEGLIDAVDWEAFGAELDIKYTRVTEVLGIDAYPEP